MKKIVLVVTIIADSPVLLGLARCQTEIGDKTGCYVRDGTRI